jgi:hypothetical protein
MKNELYNVGHIQCHKKKFSHYEFFSSNGFRRHVQNFGGPSL